MSTNTPSLLEILVSRIFGLIFFKLPLKALSSASWTVILFVTPHKKDNWIPLATYHFRPISFYFNNYIPNRLRNNSFTTALSVPGLQCTRACLSRILVRIIDQILCSLTFKQGIRKFTHLKHKSQRVVTITSLTRNAWTSGFHQISRHNTNW